MKKETERNLTILSQNEYKDRVLKDFRIISLSRSCSVFGRREVLTGKGKFGIFGDGKEVAQIALNHFFNKGDFRSGYYRDQTFMIAQGFLNAQQLFAALYAHPDVDHEPMSAGRQMGAHFSTTLVNEKGEWLDQINLKNHISDISPTAGQIPRLVGLAQASKIYRSLKIDGSEKFSKNGNEIAWGTIGNASTSEGLFFEGINAAGVLQIPMVISVWDDGYGISVENKQHTIKESISSALEGFRASEKSNGIEILTVNGWDYPALIKTYSYASKIAREKHIPVLVHVLELTQPLGHSSSGSHERYKSIERLNWEKENDCNLKMREWILSNEIASEKDLKLIEKEVTEEVRFARRKAWREYQTPIIKIKKEFNLFFNEFLSQSNNDVALKMVHQNLNKKTELFYRDIVSAARQTLPLLIRSKLNNTNNFKNWLTTLRANLQDNFSSHLYSEGVNCASYVVNSKPVYDKDAPLFDGRVILRDNFDKLLEKYDRLIIFGEDCGKIGGVNQGLEGLQEKYSEIRIADTGIREATIVGQGIGMALRGLRPIAEIQYLDYILYCIHTLSDDLASLSYRTKGRQLAPLIIRTRGHRLEGIWHSGSPMAAMIHLLRGIHIVVPRNMTQAAGFYNTLVRANQPAIVVESLNGYRLKEKMPSNLGDFCIPVGKVEVLKKGSDITLVSYGSTLRIVYKVAQELMGHDIDAEVIDIQTLIPFDLDCEIKESIAKTNKILIIDEDVPGGASAYILQQLLENQKIYPLLDSEPHLLSAKEHRTAYAEDGDYFSKPSEDDIFEKIYYLMHESNPNQYPSI